MKTRSGGKFGSSHSTLTEAGAEVADIACKSTYVTKVIHGIIVVPRGSSGRSRRVKIQIDGHALKLTVTAGASVQTMYVYASDIESAKKHISDGARMKNYDVMS